MISNPALCCNAFSFVLYMSASLVALVLFHATIFFFSFWNLENVSSGSG